MVVVVGVAAAVAVADAIAAAVAPVLVVVDVVVSTDIPSADLGDESAHESKAIKTYNQK